MRFMGAFAVCTVNSRAASFEPGKEAYGARRALPVLALITLLFAGRSYGQEMSLAEGPALAFGRYIASMQERNPFTAAGPIQVQIDASLPAFGKSGSLTAIRERGSSEQSEYRPVESTGESIIKAEWI